MKISLIRAKYFKDKEKQKLDLVLDAMGAALNSVQFREFILTHERFDTADHLTNRQVYDLIMTGNEGNGQGNDEEADLDLVMNGQSSQDIIGYTQQSRIYIYRNKFQEKSISELAGFYAHEYCHLLDFDDPTTTGPAYNVPYEVGSIVMHLTTETERVFIPDTGRRGIAARRRRRRINFNKTVIEKKRRRRLRRSRRGV